MDGSQVEAVPQSYQKTTGCCGVNTTHLKAMIRKDFTNLNRRRTFCILFLVFPPLLSYLANYVFTDALELEDSTINGSMIMTKFKHQSFDFFPPMLAPLASVGNSTAGPFGIGPNLMMVNLNDQGRAGGCKRILVAAPDKDVREKAKTYVENFMLGTNKLLAVRPDNAKKAEENRTKVFTFETRDAMDEFAKVNESENCFGMFFKKVDTKKFDYEVMMSFSQFRSIDTNKPVYRDLISKPDLTSWGKYQQTSWLYPYITDFLAKYQSGTYDFDDASEWNQRPLIAQDIGYTPMPTSDFVDQDEQTFRQLADQFPNFVQFNHLFIFIYIIQGMVGEKETKARQGMKIMGLQDGTYYLAWFIHFLFLCTYNAIWQTLFIGNIFNKVDMLILFFFWMLFSFCLFGIAIVIQALTSNSKAANGFAIVFFFLSYQLNTPFQNNPPPAGILYVISIFPTIVLIRFIKLLFIYQYQTEGMTFGNAGFVFDTYSVQGAMLMLFFMTIFYCVLGIYLDQVVPMEFGVAKPWNFLCTGRKQKRISSNSERLSDNDVPAHKKKINFEPISESLKRQLAEQTCMKVRGLKKSFGQKQAVKGVDLTMYSGQIFALLGHNGAGKTTTLSMLTGLLEQTEGEAEVFGFNVFNNMDQLRSMLGVCPQHDILFHYLTPEDHLRMFASFKGTPSNLIDDQVEKMLVDIDLYEQKNQQAHTLSGGQKRKLSVAISMIGNSKIIMLDEPTSGMDTTARRRLWEMLKKNKSDKIIILTTHYMDEADILGDRIAIMTEGEVECTGSSLFLKQRYGVGYQLIIEKAVQDDLPEVEEYLKNEIPDILKLQEVSGEISFQIPRDNSGRFKEFFEKFDQDLQRLKLRSYSVGITTLEEVFLKIGHGEDDVGQEVMANGSPDAYRQLPEVNTEEIESYSIAKSANKTFIDQFKEISMKKLKINMRTPQTFYQELIIPFVIVILFVAIGQADFLTSFPGLDMTPESYGQKGALYYNDKYSEIVCPAPTDPSSQKCNSAKPNYIAPSTIVENSMMCTEPACRSDKLFTKKEEIKISEDFLKQDEKANQTKEVEDFEKKTFEKRDGETAFIYVHELSYPKMYLKPKDPKTFTIAELEDDKKYTPTPYTGSHQFDANYVPSMGKYSLVLILDAVSPHSFGIWGAYAQEVIMREFFAKESAKSNAKVQLKIVNDPLPLGRQVESGLSSIQGFLLGFGLGIIYIIAGPSLVRNVVEEREKALKNQMIVSGVKLSSYWFGHYVKDVIFGLILGLWVIILIAIFDINLPSAWILIILAPFSIPPFLYVFSFMFEKADASGSLISFYMFIFAFIGPIAVFILQLIPSTRSTAVPLKWLCSLVCPQFAVINGIISISFKQFFGFLQPADGDCGEACDFSEPDTFDERIANIQFTVLLIGIAYWWFIVLLIDSGLWKICSRVPNTPSVKGSQDVDEDIINEEKVVEGSKPENYPIRIFGAKKNFRQFNKCQLEKIEAVKRVSFGLQYGECFALLGVSGAGKTTMFKMITGEIQPTEGQMAIIGNNVLTANGLMNARKYIGYCPQFDCLYPVLTVREHLELYASLKGIDKNLREQIIMKLMVDMGILEYEHVHSQNLSGGNRRKLSVSMAIMGNPPIIFLDEPSTGVDPQAKRFMWNIVSKISREKKQSTVILTTHSMEEAEALCNKMGIMVKGEFKCFGSASHIKDKYGTGFEIEFKVRTLSEMEVKSMETEARKNGLLPFNLQKAKTFLEQQGLIDLAGELNPNGIGFEFYEMDKKKVAIQAEELFQWQFAESNGEKFVDMITNKFQGVEIVEHWGNSWRLKIDRGNFSIGYLFGLVEENKATYEVSEYSVAQTTLEQIFNNFAASAELKQQFKKRNSIRRSNSDSRNAIQVQQEGGNIIASSDGGIDMEMARMANSTAGDHFNINKVMPDEAQKQISVDKEQV